MRLNLFNDLSYLKYILILILIDQCASKNVFHRNETELKIIQRRNVCPASAACLSKWGYCGSGEAYCGDGCLSGPCWNNQGQTGSGSIGGSNNGGQNDNGQIINEANFACVFNTIDAGTRSSRLTGLRNSGWIPSNKDEAAVFLAHVFHETDGLKTIREYCAPG